MSSENRKKNILKMLESEPDDVFLNYALAIEHLNSISTLSQAAEQLKKVLRLDPQYVAAFYQLGKVYEATGNIPEALRYFNEGLTVAESKKDKKAAGEFRDAIFLLED